MVGQLQNWPLKYSLKLVKSGQAARSHIPQLFETFQDQNSSRTWPKVEPSVNWDQFHEKCLSWQGVTNVQPFPSCDLVTFLTIRLIPTEKTNWKLLRIFREKSMPTFGKKKFGWTPTAWFNCWARPVRLVTTRNVLLSRHRIIGGEGTSTENAFLITNL